MHTLPHFHLSVLLLGVSVKQPVVIAVDIGRFQLRSDKVSAVFGDDVCEMVVFLCPIETLDEVVEVVVEGYVVDPGLDICIEVFVEERVLEREVSLKICLQQQLKLKHL